MAIIYSRRVAYKSEYPLNLKKVFYLAIIALIFIYSEEFFPIFIGVFIIFIILLLVIELLLDVYIVIMILIESFRK